MRIPLLLLGVVAAVALGGGDARANPPADALLDLPEPGPRLSLLSFWGPGLRAIYDHRFPIEPDMSEVRTQVIGDVNFAYSEVSANVDIRLFLLTFGASAGYHYEWHVLEFTPGSDGRDTAGQPEPVPPGLRFSDLHREARRIKDLNGDYREQAWLWAEGRVGFAWPAPRFMGVSTAAVRHEDRPDNSFDWAQGTVTNGGFQLVWESMALFRDRKRGFAGPALKILKLPRTGPEDLARPPTAPCRSMPSCDEQRVWEVQYGVVGGLRPNLVRSADLAVLRVYTTYGLDNPYFGMHGFGLPLSILAGYQVDIAL